MSTVYVGALGRRAQALYQLTKPGIIYGNLVTAAAGFLFGSKWHVAVRLFAATLSGTALVIAAACVYNNYIDRGIDRHMARTKRRALASGTISGRTALIFASMLAVLGFIILTAWTNTLVVWIGVVALVDYVGLYGWAKRRTPWGTVVGSVSGSAPLVAGYAATRGRLDATACILFIIMTCWQMPHFYAIAIYRLKDYRSAGLPVLPVARGVAVAKRRIVGYIIAFALANVLLSLVGPAGATYAIVMIALSAVWLARGWQGFAIASTRQPAPTNHADAAASDTAWAKRMFLFSLIVMLGMSGMLAVGSLLP